MSRLRTTLPTRQLIHSKPLLHCLPQRLGKTCRHVLRIAEDNLSLQLCITNSIGTNQIVQIHRRGVFITGRNRILSIRRSYEQDRAIDKMRLRPVVLYCL